MAEPVKLATELTLVSARAERSRLGAAKHIVVEAAFNDMRGRPLATVRRHIPVIPQRDIDFVALRAYQRRTAREEIEIRAGWAGVRADVNSAVVTWWLEQ